MSTRDPIHIESADESLRVTLCRKDATGERMLKAEFADSADCKGCLRVVKKRAEAAKRLATKVGPRLLQVLERLIETHDNPARSANATNIMEEEDAWREARAVVAVIHGRTAMKMKGSR